MFCVPADITLNACVVVLVRADMIPPAPAGRTVLFVPVAPNTPAVTTCGAMCRLLTLHSVTLLAVVPVVLLCRCSRKYSPGWSVVTHGICTRRGPVTHDDQLPALLVVFVEDVPPVLSVTHDMTKDCEVDE